MQAQRITYKWQVWYNNFIYYIMNKIIVYFLVAITPMVSVFTAMGQMKASSPHDTTYYVTYSNLLTTRLYGSRKYTDILVRDHKGPNKFRYLSNTPNNLGIGATYGILTLNLGANIGLSKPNIEAKGKTKYLDLQAHAHARKFNVDLIGEFYKGFYLPPFDKAATNGDNWYKRPDIRVTNLGIAAYKIFNWERFSFRAAMLQNERQKKSAGSLLAGAEIYYGQTKGDSSLIPSVLQNEFTQYGVNKLRYFSIGPGIGYAYTLVVAKHFYVLGSATASVPLTFNQERSFGSKESQTSVQPNLSYKAAIGYNQERWSINALWINNSLRTKGTLGRYEYNTGNIRANLVYRFNSPSYVKRKLGFLEIR